jgi:ferrous iron transport protein B
MDATNLERNLFLASQVMELQRPSVVALNMVDAAATRALTVDPDKLRASWAARSSGLGPRPAGIADLQAALEIARDPAGRFRASRSCPASPPVRLHRLPVPGAL